MLQTTYLPFNTRANWYGIQKKNCLFLPRCLPVTQDALVCHMITGNVYGGSVIFLWQGQIWNLTFLLKGGQSSFCGSLPQRSHNNRGTNLLLLSPHMVTFLFFHLSWCCRPLTFLSTQVNWYGVNKKNLPLFAKMSASYPECLTLSQDHRKFYQGVSHLSMNRPNLKFEIFGDGGGSIIFGTCPSSTFETFC